MVLPMKSDVVFSSVVNPNKDGISFVNSYGWPWKLPIYSQDIFGAA